VAMRLSVHRSVAKPAAMAPRSSSRPRRVQAFSSRRGSCPGMGRASKPCRPSWARVAAQRQTHGSLGAADDGHGQRVGGRQQRGDVHVVMWPAAAHVDQAGFGSEGRLVMQRPCRQSAERARRDGGVRAGQRVEQGSHWCHEAVFTSPGTGPAARTGPRTRRRGRQCCAPRAATGWPGTCPPSGRRATRPGRRGAAHPGRMRPRCGPAA